MKESRKEGLVESLLNTNYFCFLVLGLKIITRHKGTRQTRMINHLNNYRYRNTKRRVIFFPGATNQNRAINTRGPSLRSTLRDAKGKACDGQVCKLDLMRVTIQRRLALLGGRHIIAVTWQVVCVAERD